MDVSKTIYSDNWQVLNKWIERNAPNVEEEE